MPMVEVLGASNTIRDEIKGYIPLVVAAHLSCEEIRLSAQEVKVRFIEVGKDDFGYSGYQGSPKTFMTIRARDVPSRRANLQIICNKILNEMKRPGTFDLSELNVTIFLVPMASAG